MASVHKTAASRLNSLRSTGPRTSGGKKRSGQNALRHGLAVRLVHNPMLSSRIKRVAKAIAGQKADPIDFDLATSIAELELDLRQIRMVRVSLLGKMEEQSISAASTVSAEGDQLGETATAVDRLVKIDRYERRVLSRRKRAIRNLYISDC